MYVIYHDKVKTGFSSEHGIPSGPLFIYILGAWYQGKNLVNGKVREKYLNCFGVQLKEDSELYGPFNSEEELKKFMYLVGEELDAPAIKFLSLSELSRLIGKSVSVDELKNSLNESAEEMKNVDKVESDSLIHRIFSKTR